MLKIIPSIFTFMRIILTPVIIWMLGQNGYEYFWMATGIFACAAVTDLIDGYLARKMGATSAFGEFFDPLADKLFVLGLMAFYVHSNVMSLGIFLVFVGRDLVLTIVRGLVVGHGFAWKTSRLAKWKTAMQFFVLCGGFVVIGLRAGFIGLSPEVVLSLFKAALYGVAALTFYSACDYLIRYHETVEQIMLRYCVGAWWRNASATIASLGMHFFRLPAPGTVASIVTIGIGYFCMPHAYGAWGVSGGIILAILFFVGWITATIAAHIYGSEDPGHVVIDECVGMVTVLFMVPLTTFWGYFLALLLFRLFDVFKIFPVNFVEKRYRGGMGIMLDDLAAAGCTSGVLYLLSTIIVL